MLDDDPVVIDFGIAHVADDVRLTMTGLVMGTPVILAPELLNGSAVTAATDWWGWAATLAFAASGQTPFGHGPRHGVVIDRVRRGEPDLSAVDSRLRPLLRAALSSDPRRAARSPEVLAALERFALGGEATVAISASSTPPAGRSRPVWSSRRPPTRTPRNPFRRRRFRRRRFRRRCRPLFSIRRRWRRASRCTTDRRCNRVRRVTTRWGSSDPQVRSTVAPPAKPPRTGTLLAILVALVGAGSCWPTVTAVVAAALIVLARTADRSLLAIGRRRQARGPSRSDSAVAVVATPWHLLRAIAASVPGLILPAVLGLSAAFCAGVVSGSTSLSGAGASTVAASQVAAAVGMLVALLVAWWGPGGASVRRGSRGLVRGLVRGETLTAAVIVLCIAGGCAAAYLAYTRGHPTFGPLHSLLGVTLP